MKESSTPLTPDQKLDKIIATVVNISEDVKDIKSRLTNVEAAVNQHTTILDGLAKNVQLLLEEKTISAARLDRLEKWAEQAGKKIGVKLDLGTLSIEK